MVDCMIEAHALLAHLVCTIFTLRNTYSYLWIHLWCGLDIINLVLDIYTLALLNLLLLKWLNYFTIFFLLACSALGGSNTWSEEKKWSDAYCTESTWQFTRPFDALHICSLYHASGWYCMTVEILKSCSPSQYCNLFCCQLS